MQDYRKFRYTLIDKKNRQTGSLIIIDKQTNKLLMQK